MSESVKVGTGKGSELIRESSSAPMGFITPSTVVSRVVTRPPPPRFSVSSMDSCVNPGVSNFFIVLFLMVLPTLYSFSASAICNVNVQLTFGLVNNRKL